MMYLLTTVLLLSLMCLAVFPYTKALPREQANEEEPNDDYWQNNWHEDLFVDCNPTDAIEVVHSKFSDYYKDRRWRWDCYEVIGGFPEWCEWYLAINDFAEDMEFECPLNQYMAGVLSYYDLDHEDRKWSVKCCRKRDACSTVRLWSNYINEYEGNLWFQGLSTGLYSVYDENSKDRRWKVLEDQLEYCEEAKTPPLKTIN